MQELGVGAFFMGGTPGAQTVDILQTAQLHTEFACDNGSVSFMAIVDVRQFYDHIAPVRFAWSMQDHGFSEEFAGSAARLHVAPTVVIQHETEEFVISCRTKAFLAGSNSAAVLAMLPMLGCVAYMEADCTREALPLQPQKYVDLVETGFALSGRVWRSHAISD
jgi:hypothetical protein